MLTFAFDVDGTLIDSLSGTSLRPGTTELIDRLSSTGHRVVLWSAGGATYAAERAATHGIEADAFFDKDLRDADGRYVATALSLEGAEVIFIDDRPEDMPRDATVIALSPYLSHNPHDRGLDRVVVWLDSAGH
mgnify:CR=1 FL=1